MVSRRSVLGWGLGAAFGSAAQAGRAQEKPHRFLYVASPGVRNYTEWGGIGVLVFDIDADYRFVKRIPLPQIAEGGAVENVKGICACAHTGRLYVSTIKRLVSLDLTTDKAVWNRTYEGGCDRMSITPNGKTIYLPSLEGPHWHAVDGLSGEVVKKIVPDSGAHNTLTSLGSTRAYLAGLKSPLLRVVDTTSNEIIREVGPFSAPIRPFTINGKASLAYVNVNDLLGFEIGDLRKGRVRHRVEVPGFKKGPVKRHGCPSHGIGLTPDETQVWLCDGANNALHVFDNTVMPPVLMGTVMLREQPGWVTFTLNGKHAIPSTGEIVNVATRKIIHTLKDEEGRQVHSEKLLEIDFQGTQPVRNGDQFGVGRVR